MKIKTKHTQGFTLIETMVTVAILGIVSAIAIPSYAEHVKKSRRTDAQTELYRLAQIQESFYAQNLTYARRFNGAAATGGLGFPPGAITTENGHYSVSIASVPAGCGGTAISPCTGFFLRAQPVGAQTGDTECAAYTLIQTGLRGNPTGTGTVQDCWK